MAVIYCATLVISIAVLTLVLLVLVGAGVQSAQRRSGPADEGRGVTVWLELVWVLVPPLIVAALLGASWHRMTVSMLAC